MRLVADGGVLAARFHLGKSGWDGWIPLREECPRMARSHGHCTVDIVLKMAWDGRGRHFENYTLQGVLCLILLEHGSI